MKTIHNAIALLFVMIPLFATAQQPVMQRLGNWLPDTVALSGSAQDWLSTATKPSCSATVVNASSST